jgi:hypothetical protein
MNIHGYRISNTYASKRTGKHGVTLYPACVRVYKEDGTELAKVVIEGRSHDPLGYIQKKHIVEPSAATARQELISKLLVAGVATEHVEAILRPVSKVTKNNSK